VKKTSKAALASNTACFFSRTCSSWTSHQFM